MDNHAIPPPEILSLLGLNDEPLRKEKFFCEIIKFVDRAGMKDSHVYKAIGMQKDLWYRMRNNEKARTKKENILKLVIVLRLSFWEAYYLIALAGYSFVPGIDETDGIIRDCLLNNIYNPVKVDEMLDDKGLPVLFSEI